GRPARLRHPQAVRPWQHVLDCLSGYLSLARRLALGEEVAEAWNFGPAAEDARTVGWIARRAAEAWGEGAACEIADSHVGHETARLLLDSAKARQRLDWRPAWAVDEALDRTLSWYRAWADGADLAAFSRGQIAAHRAETS
ncbi:MAG: CDP-glucose 4,6-dehydratase, partial [Alphaproteobacteria bacterium]|nr:CDP-glucose 4,6-dehydratase [Alphaproteobacteria bacterium]